MKVEGFFSYDVFVGGLFGVKSFLFLVFILIFISSLYMWGFVILFRNAVVSRSKQMWILGFFSIFVSFLFHFLMLQSGFASEKPERVVWLSVLSLIFAIVIASYAANPLKKMISNWVAPLLGIIASATLPVFFSEVTSDIVKVGLENYKVGGSIQASIHKVDSGEKIKSGRLLLVTPQYVYLREGDSGYISISRNGNTYISVQ